MFSASFALPSAPALDERFLERLPRLLGLSFFAAHCPRYSAHFCAHSPVPGSSFWAVGASFGPFQSTVTFSPLEFTWIRVRDRRSRSSAVRPSIMKGRKSYSANAIQSAVPHAGASRSNIRGASSSREPNEYTATGLFFSRFSRNAISLSWRKLIRTSMRVFCAFPLAATSSLTRVMLGEMSMRTTTRELFSVRSHVWRAGSRKTKQSSA